MGILQINLWWSNSLNQWRRIHPIWRSITNNFRLRRIGILKLDSSGSFSWAKSFGGTEYDYGTSLIVDSLRNVNIS